MGFQNEKDHPEVAPSQFEINYGYGEVWPRRPDSTLQLLTRADRQQHGLHGQLPPQSRRGREWQRLHTNVSISQEKTNLFWDPQGQEKLSAFGWSSSTAS